MNINEAKNSYLGIERQKEIGILCDLVNKNGSCLMDGYLGVDNISFSFDDLGLLEFYTEKEEDGLTTKSNGVVLDDCVVIKQVQDCDLLSYNQLMSWDILDNSYTYIGFDDVNVLNDCYDKIKKRGINLAKEDISLKFTELGISFESIAQVLLNQKVDSLSLMVDEARASQVIDDGSFML